MALAIVTSLAAVAGGLTHSPIAILSLIPLIAVGLNYYRYQSVDPESRIVDATTVSYQSKDTHIFSFHFNYLLFSVETTI